MSLIQFFKGLNRRQFLIVAAVAAVAVYFVLVFTGIIPGLRTSFGPSQAITIEVWGVYDDELALREVFDAYLGGRTDLRINYRRFNFETYERELVDALAAGRGPDVFMIHNTWLPKHYDKILPFEETQLTAAVFDGLFPTVVKQDFTAGGRIYALPLFVDTLAMIYNKDVFDRKKIAQPPRNWTEFLTVVPKLRELDPETRTVKKAAAAIGGSKKSVNRATDLLSLLMLQSGVQMTTRDFSRASFSELQGLKAFDFYLQFANPANPYYTWNDDFHYSIDSFIENDTAVIFNYAHQLKIIKEKNPFLDAGVAPVPQPTSGQPVNYANYWGLAVSKKSVKYQAARQMVLGVTTDEKAASRYSRLFGKPPALRSLIGRGLDDPLFGVFNRQSLTARSWPQADNVMVEQIFSDMIESVARGRLTSTAALKQAEDRVTKIMERGK